MFLLPPARGTFPSVCRQSLLPSLLCARRRPPPSNPAPSTRASSRRSSLVDPTRLSPDDSAPPPLYHSPLIPRSLVPVTEVSRKLQSSWAPILLSLYAPPGSGILPSPHTPFPEWPKGKKTCLADAMHTLPVISTQPALVEGLARPRSQQVPRKLPLPDFCYPPMGTIGPPGIRLGVDLPLKPPKRILIAL